MHRVLYRKRIRSTARMKITVSKYQLLAKCGYQWRQKIKILYFLPLQGWNCLRFYRQFELTFNYCFWINIAQNSFLLFFLPWSTSCVWMTYKCHEQHRTGHRDAQKCVSVVFQRDRGNQVTACWRFVPQQWLEKLDVYLMMSSITSQTMLKLI